MRSRLARILLVLVVVGAGWFWGVQTVRRQIFPYDLLVAANSVLTGDGAAVRGPLAGQDLARLVDHVASIKLATIADGPGLREDLMRRVVLPRNKVVLAREPGSGGEEVLTASFYGIRISGVLASPAGEGRSCLVVYYQGHLGSAHRFDYRDDLRGRVLDGGCDLLSLSMLGSGQNAGPASFPSESGGGGRTFRSS